MEWGPALCTKSAGVGGAQRYVSLARSPPYRDSGLPLVRVGAYSCLFVVATVSFLLCFLSSSAELFCVGMFLVAGAAKTRATW